MSDDRSKTGQADRIRINVNQEHELRDWSAKFHVTPGELRAAVHALICRSPSVLVGLALDDLSGETEPVNVPGVGPDRFASWTRKMREPIEVITTSSETTLTIHCGERHRPTDG